MNIAVTMVLGADETAQNSANDIATKILEAVGGDPETDVCTVSIQDYGQVGGLAPVPVPPTEPPTEPVEEVVIINSMFATNNSPPPGDKQVRTNATALESVTAIYVDNESTEGDDISTQLLALVMGDIIDLHGVNDTNRYGKFALSAAPIDQTDFVELPVNLSEAGNPLTNGACKLIFQSR